jgi:hypothetical protein
LWFALVGLLLGKRKIGSSKLRIPKVP